MADKEKKDKKDNSLSQQIKDAVSNTEVVIAKAMKALVDKVGIMEYDIDVCIAPYHKKKAQPRQEGLNVKVTIDYNFTN